MAFDDRKVSASRKAQAIKELKAWEDKKAIILNPFGSIVELSYLYQFVFVPQYFDPNTDYYPISGGSPTRYSLRGSAIIKLGVNARIEWRASESGFVPISQDGRQVAYKAVGGLRRTDGSIGGWVDQVYQKDLDVIRDKEEARIRALKYAVDWSEEKIMHAVNKSVNEERSHILTKAESGAKLRVIRSLLGIKSVLAEERSLPWVVVRVDTHPDFGDPMLKQLAAAHAMGIAPQLFPVPAALPAPVQDAEYTTDCKPGKMDDDIPFDDGEPDPKVLQPEEFEMLQLDEKIGLCRDLADRTGYDLGSLPWPLDDIAKYHNAPDAQLLRLYNLLIKRSRKR